jgi:hypothetical protein
MMFFGGYTAQDFCNTVNTDICWKEVELLGMIKACGIFQMVKTHMVQK